MNFATGDALYIAPLLILAVAGMLLVLAEAFYTGKDRTALAGLACAGGVAAAVASFALYRHMGADQHRLLYGEMLVADRTGYALSTLLSVVVALSALVAPAHMRAHRWAVGEYFGILLLAGTGMVMLAMASHLATVFIGVETMSLGVYVMTALRRRSRRGNEAAMKYFLMGAFATGFLLYGMALVYGATGSTSLVVVRERLASGNLALLTVGGFLMVAAFAFKVAAVPFHMWAPDAYEGAPTPVTAFFASAPKMAAVAITLRTVMEAFPNIVHEWRQIVMFISIASMALGSFAAIHRDNVRSSEAGLKYFVLGALSSGMLLYGASLLYGFTGSTSFATIAAVAKGADGAANLGLIIGLVFLLVGLAFKVSAVPFHMWTPDVYEGAPTPITAFFAAAPKMAAMALLVRVLMTAFPGLTAQWQQIITFVSILSMVVGSLAAIGQTNIKRLMAYSSIGHVGFALVGLAAATPEGVQGVLVYMTIYLVMTLGTFACILAMRRDAGQVEDIAELGGLANTNLWMAFVLAMLMFSLAGIPPLAGFWAKWYVFLAAVNAGLWPLAIIGVIASVVGAYYYLRIVKVMFFDDAKAPFLPISGSIGLVMAASALFVLLYVVYPSPLVKSATAAAASLR